MGGRPPGNAGKDPAQQIIEQGPTDGKAMWGGKLAAGVKSSSRLLATLLRQARIPHTARKTLLDFHLVTRSVCT